MNADEVVTLSDQSLDVFGKGVSVLWLIKQIERNAGNDNPEGCRQRAQEAIEGMQKATAALQKIVDASFEDWG
jgi:hypothetical protein